METNTQAATTGNIGVGEGDVRPVKTPSERLSDAGGDGDNINNSALQKQATQTQRLLGGLDDQLAKALEDLKDHEHRIMKLENKAAASER